MADKKISQLEVASLSEVKANNGLIMAAVPGIKNYAINSNNIGAANAIGIGLNGNSFSQDETTKVITLNKFNNVNNSDTNIISINDDGTLTLNKDYNHKITFCVNIGNSYYMTSDYYYDLLFRLYKNTTLQRSWQFTIDDNKAKEYYEFSYIVPKMTSQYNYQLKLDGTYFGIYNNKITVNNTPRNITIDCLINSI